MTRQGINKIVGVCFALLFSVSLALPLVGQAAELFFKPAEQEVGPGQEFQIDLMLDTEGKAINALEGRLVFPAKLVDLVGVYDGSSVVTLWLEKSVKADSVDFSGVIPGGFNGILAPYHEDRPEPGKILSFIFKTRAVGEGNINLSNVQALLNDGQGTADRVAAKNFRFKVLTKAGELSQPRILSDQEPPEPFIPQIIKDPNLFSGQWILIFATQDKDSGIDHYEVKEGKRDFVISESPYLLTNQELTDKIIVKAVDQAGNERIAVLPPQNPLSWFKNYWFWGIIIIVAIIILWLIKIILKKKKKWVRMINH